MANKVGKKEHVLRWVDNVCSVSSVHGFAWYHRIEQRTLKTIIFLFVMVLCMGLPILLVQQILEFSQTMLIKSAVKMRQAKSVVYPNITVCNPLFFKRSKMEAYNISDVVATYMTLTLDFGNADAYERFKLNDSFFFGLGSELDALQDTHNLTLFQLFQAIAVDCEHFFVECSVHGTRVDCCRDLFSPKPFFSEKGTCFTTNRLIAESVPYEFSSIRVYLRLNETEHPDFSMLIRGGGAAENGAVIHTLSWKDHPLAAMRRNPLRARPGEDTHVGISFKEIDRSNLGESFCKSKEAGKSFEDTFRIPYTYHNCHIIRTFVKGPWKCAILSFIGLDNNYGSGTVPICKPVTVLEPVEMEQMGNLSIHNLSSIVLEREDTDHRYFCQHECQKTELFTTTSSGILLEHGFEEMRKLLAYYNITMDLTAKQTAALQYYFSTFEYEEHVLYQESLIDFISKIGGWIGFGVGASMVSFIEFIYFSFILIRSLCSPMSKYFSKSSIQDETVSVTVKYPANQ